MVHHAQATQVWVRISVQNDHIVVVVADNGHGLESRKREAGEDGIANMKERLKSLGGVCDIKSEGQTGTTVRFEAPLPRKLL